MGKTDDENDSSAAATFRAAFQTPSSKSILTALILLVCLALIGWGMYAVFVRLFKPCGPSKTIQITI